MAGSELDAAHVAHDDLGIELAFESQRPVDIERLAVRGKSFIKAIGSCQSDGVCVVEDTGLAVNPSGKSNSLCNRGGLRGAGCVEVTARPLHARLHCQAFETLLRVTA